MMDTKKKSEGSSAGEKSPKPPSNSSSKMSDDDKANGVPPKNTATQKQNKWDKPLQIKTSNPSASSSSPPQAGAAASASSKPVSPSPPPGLMMNSSSSPQSLSSPSEGQQQSAGAKKGSSSNNNRPPPKKAWSTAAAAPPQSQKGSKVGNRLTEKAQPTAAPGNPLAIRERFLHLCLNLVGQSVVVHLRNGKIMQGVLYTATPFADLPGEQRNKYLLKAAKVLKQGDDEQREEKLEKQALSTLQLDMSEVLQLHIKSMRLETADNAPSASEFATDTDISREKSNANKGGSLLEAGSAWTSAPGGSSSAVALDDSVPKNSRAMGLLPPGGRKSSGSTPNTSAIKGSIGDWDQFKANESLFNVKGTYDENLYTTALDKDGIDQAQMDRAAKLAAAIEGTQTSNPHLAEERGHVLATDYDEEDRYSGVLRKLEISDTTASSKATGTTNSKTMNYAAAAATAKKGIVSKSGAFPPGFRSRTSTSPSDKGEPQKRTDSKNDSKVAEESPGVATDDEKKPDKENNKTGDEAKVKGKEPSKKQETGENEGDDKGKEATANKDGDEKDSKGVATKRGSSKLNPNAKSFSLSVNAKSFTPSGSMTGGPAVEPQVPQPYGVDPSTGMPLGAAPHMQPQQGGHIFVPAGPMGQPGIIPIVNPPYPGVRYPAQTSFPAQMQQQSRHVHQHQQGPSGPPPPPLPQQLPQPVSAQTSGTISPATGSVSEEDDAKQPTQDEDSADSSKQVSATAAQSAPAVIPESQQHPNASHSQQGHMQAPQAMPVPYMQTPGGYYGGQMGMQQQGSASQQQQSQQQRGPNQQAYPQQPFMQMPHHQAGVQGMYRQMYPAGGMPPNIPPNMMPGSSYYGGPQNAAGGGMQHQPHGGFSGPQHYGGGSGYDDGGRNYRPVGRGRGGGRNGRTGRTNYQQNRNTSGRNSNRRPSSNYQNNNNSSGQVQQHSEQDGETTTSGEAAVSETPPNKATTTE